MQKQKEAKTLNEDFKLDSANLQNLARFFGFFANAQNDKMVDCHADSTNLLAMTKINNRSNGGVAFVFVENFGLSTRLKSVEVQNFLQVRNCIPQDKLPNP